MLSVLYYWLVFLPCALGSIVTYNWDITWVTASPDGFERPVIGINNQFPCPAINVNIGDRLIININNRLGNESTSIHFHGLFQHGSNAMDGPSGVTQCPVMPGNSFTYDFVVNQPGTYWYHAHNKGQYIDGLRGPFIVHDPSAPFKYDEEVVLTVSDWYQDQAPGLINYFQSASNENDNGGSEPIPNSAVMQDTQNVTFSVKPKTTYLIRIVNIGAFVGSYLKFDGHDITIVEVDGVYTKPQKVSELYLTVAQRYSVLLTTKSDISNNFAILSTLDTGMFDHVPPWANPDVFGFLVYDPSKPLPAVSPLRNYNVYDDFQLIPKDRQVACTNPDQQLMLTMDFTDDSGVNRATINNISYITPVVPTLYTALSAPADYVSNPLIYGTHTNSYVLSYNAIIEIVLINLDGGDHPWHLHGHNFQIIARSPPNTPYHPSAIHPPHTPIRRDTVQVHAGGYLVIRFRADNPGIQLFHCHIEWHVEAGLTATLIEAPELLQSQKPPRGHYETCKGEGVKTEGNAAGNTHDWGNLTGQNVDFDQDNWGALLVKPRRKREAWRKRKV